MSAACLISSPNMLRLFLVPEENWLDSPSSYCGEPQTLLSVSQRSLGVYLSLIHFSTMSCFPRILCVSSSQISLCSICKVRSGQFCYSQILLTERRFLKGQQCRERAVLNTERKIFFFLEISLERVPLQSPVHVVSSSREPLCTSSLLKIYQQEPPKLGDRDKRCSSPS